jgi:hypothetical protein
MRTKAVLLTTVLALAGWLVAPGIAVAGGLADPTREEIFEQLETDDVSADYVILIDTSGSMSTGGLYREVRSSLEAFLDDLAKNDHVAIYTFDNRVIPRYVGQAARVSTMLAGVPTAPTPGGATDIGAAINKAIFELERATASPVASVVLLTDGDHDPPPGSAYPTASGDSWEALKTRAGKLKAKSVTGYALPLRGVTGASLLGTVFTNTVVLDPKSIGELGQYLDRAKAGTRLDKARLKLESDIGKGVTAIWDAPSTLDLNGRDAEVSLTLKSQTSRVPLALTGLSIRQSGGVQVTSDLPQHVDLGPGEAKTLIAKVSWQPQPWLIPFRQRLEVPFSPEVNATVTSPWAAALSPGIDLKTPGRVQSTTSTSVAVAETGTWRAQLITALSALLVLLVIGRIGYARRRPRKSGMLVASHPFVGQELGRFPLGGRGRVRLEGQRLPGAAKVVARRVPIRREDTSGIEYEIVYQRAKFTETSRCPVGGSVIISGISFEHLPAGRQTTSAFARPAETRPPLEPA